MVQFEPEGTMAFFRQSNVPALSDAIVPFEPMENEHGVEKMNAKRTTAAGSAVPATKKPKVEESESFDAKELRLERMPEAVLARILGFLTRECSSISHSNAT